MLVSPLRVRRGGTIRLGEADGVELERDELIAHDAIERGVEKQLDVAVVEERIAVEADIVVVAGLGEHLVEAVEVDPMADLGEVVLEPVQCDVNDEFLGGARGEASIGKRRGGDAVAKVSGRFDESTNELLW